MHITIRNQKYSIPAFRAVNPIESFRSYVESIAAHLYNFDNLRVIRCSISGSRAALVESDEWADMWRSGLAAIGRYELGDDVLHIDSEVVQDTLEAVWESINNRLLIAARPSPALLMENGSYALAHVSESRQVSVLLNALLHDPRYIRNTFKSSDDHLDRLTKVFTLFDWVDAEYDDSFDELRKALLFLDSTYRISHLQFTKHETNRLAHVSKPENLDPAKLLAFVYELTAYRNRFGEIEAMPKRWSQIAVANESIRISESARRQFSNVYEAPVTGRVATRGGNKPAANTSKPATPKTEAQAVKAQRVNRFQSLLQGMNAPKV